MFCTPDVNAIFSSTRDRFEADYDSLVDLGMVFHERSQTFEIAQWGDRRWISLDFHYLVNGYR